jgi:hypothetical protein
MITVTSTYAMLLSGGETKNEGYRKSRSDREACVPIRDGPERARGNAFFEKVRMSFHVRLVNI